MSAMTDSRAVEVLERLENALPVIGVMGWPLGVEAVQHAIARLREPAGVGGDAEWLAKWVLEFVTHDEDCDALTADDADTPLPCACGYADAVDRCERIAAAHQPPAEAQACPCGLPTCGESWEPGCGLGNSEQHAEAQADPSFAEWLATEMPAGTVIGDPAWWASRIARQYAKRCKPAEAQAQGGGDYPRLATPDQVGLYQGPDDCPHLQINGVSVAVFPAGTWAEVCDAFDSITGSTAPPIPPVGMGAFESRLRGRAGPFTAQTGERYVDADIALSVLREALAQKPAAVAPMEGEVAAFEAWARCQFKGAEAFDRIDGRPGGWEYNGDMVQAAWAAWQQRSCLAQQPAAVDEAMVDRYVAAVNTHLGGLSPKDWEVERFNPAESIRRVARIGLAAAFAQPQGGAK